MASKTLGLLPTPITLTFGINSRQVHVATTAGTKFFYHDTYEHDKKRHTERGFWIGCNIIPGVFGLYFDYGRKYRKQPNST